MPTTRKQAALQEAHAEDKSGDIKAENDEVKADEMREAEQTTDEPPTKKMKTDGKSKGIERAKGFNPMTGVEITDAW